MLPYKSPLQFSLVKPYLISALVKMKKYFVCFAKKIIEHFWSNLCTRISCLVHSCQGLMSWSLEHVILVLSRLNPFWIQLGYFIFFSVSGYFSLKVSKPKTASIIRPKDIDLFFTSVSAVTVSSMSTVEMEVFSNSQLVILTFLMILGGEVFTSMIRLHLMMIISKFTRNQRTENRIDTISSDSSNSNDLLVNQIELGLITNAHMDNEKPTGSTNIEMELKSSDLTKYNSIKCLGYMILGYLVVIHVAGASMISIYINYVPSARKVLKNKGLRMDIFSVFTTVATFANCGFLPTNENMVVFKKNTGLLLILIPQVLLGNTLYPPCLLLVILVLERITKRAEFSYIFKNYRELGYSTPLLSGLHSCFLAVTVLAFILLQFMLFCWMEWNSQTMDGLNSYQKLVGSLFQVVNTRHTGESVFDLSIISPAILVLFVIMMYLPPYTSFLPIDQDRKKVSRIHDKTCKRQRKKYVEYLLFSQLFYLGIFIILICITERENLKEDPLNFNVLNIVIEVISAYGNVGFTMGYSCQRQVKPDSHCKDAWYGFAGRWSDKGKLILILVMFFGRLQKFHLGGGRARKLS